ncbi:hypothetical protein E2C01_054559 [Portunus trituberculatus]|uniref:Uncharacterized protein n=1 Tax=Portunus trituberculatus TaxID=210409 RepID=A0A5B7GP04_PORTR|nr:hypothetical protein [Portunus trituberculatus]
MNKIAQQQEGLLPQAAGTHQPPHKPRCGNCRARHKPGKGSCPAEMQTYYNCVKVGHLLKVCRSRGKKAAVSDDVEASGILTTAVGKVQAQPCI